MFTKANMISQVTAMFTKANMISQETTRKWRQMTKGPKRELSSNSVSQMFVFLPSNQGGNVVI
jgi:hypothetical protein